MGWKGWVLTSFLIIIGIPIAAFLALTLPRVAAILGPALPGDSSGAPEFQAGAAMATVFLAYVPAIVTTVYVHLTGQAVHEAEQTGQVAAQALAQARAEHKARYEVFLAVGKSVVDDGHNWRLEITNLGPGPAERIDVTALYYNGQGDSPRVRVGTVRGIPVAGKAEVELLDVVASTDHDPFADLPQRNSGNHVMVKTVAWTVMKEAMPPRWFGVPLEKYRLH